MKTLFCFSNDGKDIPLGERELERQFLLNPSTIHPFLTLKDYFRTIVKFLSRNHSSLESSLGLVLNRQLKFDNIQKVIIRSKKHGAFYHLARIDIFIDDAVAKFALCAALFPEGKSNLYREFDALHYLTQRFAFSYLPRPHLIGEIDAECRTKREKFKFVLSEWLAGYSEWHYTGLTDMGDQQIYIWDEDRGPTYAYEHIAETIFRNMGRILTYYYDTKSYRQIHPWHRAAGDFVVKFSCIKPEVKLTTVRVYRPFAIFRAHPPENPLIALFYFFPNLGIRLRLDRVEGVGRITWANNKLLEKGGQGFVDSLRLMHKEGLYGLGSPEEFIRTIKRFSPQDLITAFSPLLDMHKTESLEESDVITGNLREHSKELHDIIQSIH